MNDIAPELLEKVQKTFDEETKGIREDMKNGVKSYEEAYSYAKKVGEALSKSFGVNITPEVLPDGRMYYNIADKVVRPMLKAEHELSSEAAVKAQSSANKAAGIGIKAQKVEFDEEKAQGIIDRVSSEPYENISWILNEPVKTFSKSVVDQTLEKNIEFQGKSGLSPKIVRKATGDACPWCQAVAGTYSYPNVPHDVYRRHSNCDCIVEYVDGGKYKYQDVWTKAEYNNESERATANERKAAEAKAKMRGHRLRDSEDYQKRLKVMEDLVYNKGMTWAQAGAYVNRIETQKEIDKIIDGWWDKKTNHLTPEERIKAAKEGRNKPPTFRGYPVTQKQIDDIISEELKDIQFAVHPTYNARLKSQGKTTASKYPWGEIKQIEKIEIGKQHKDTKECLIDTLIHEHLESQILLNKDKDEFYNKLFSAGDSEIHAYIDGEIKKYFEDRGWNYDMV